MKRLLPVTIAFLLGLAIPVHAQFPAGIVDPIPAETPPSMNPLDGMWVESWAEGGPQVWARGEYVFWAIGTSKLVEIGREAYNSEQFNALLDAAGKDWGDVARRLLGSERWGVRFSAGAWLDGTQTIGVEAGLLYLDRPDPLTLNLLRRDLAPLERLINTNAPELERPDRPLQALLLLRRIGVPALDALGRLVIVPFAAQNLVDANVTVEIAEQTFWMAEAIGKGRVFNADGVTVDALVGYRRIYYEDTMRVRTQVTTLAPPLIPGLQLNSVDQVRAESTYDGALLGLDLAASCGCWTFALRPTATIACLRADIIRTGSTTVTFPDQSQIQIPEGAYLRSSDQGTFSTQKWTVIPEVAIRASRAFGDCVSLTFGSSLIYLPYAGRAAPNFEFGLDPDRAMAGAVGTRQERTVVPPQLKAIFLSTFSVGLEVRF